MGTLMVPPADRKPWPTLGPQVCEFLEDLAVHGPGDLKGRPYRLDDDKRGLVYRMYEVFPRDHPRAGRRRYKRCVVSLRKGTAKTELAAEIAYAELHPEAPVRCDGWRWVGRSWQPVGRPVADPYIPMIAYTEEQTEELAYKVLYVVCSEGPDADLFDVGLDRILRLDHRGRADGKAVALAGAPDSKDGALTTHQHVDESHRLKLPRHIAAHETMLQNIPKRSAADAWTHETSTSYAPGEGSVMESAHELAEKIAKGKVADPTYFFFHREATPREGEDLDDPQQLRAAIREASGPAIAGWEDFDGQVEAIAGLYTAAKERGAGPYFERVWLNRRRQGARQAFDLVRWKKLAKAGFVIAKGDPVSAGFDGSRWRDSTGLVVTDIDGHQQVVKVWEHDGSDGWEVPEDEVDAAVDHVAEHWTLVRLYGDPAQGWDGGLARWAGKYGPKKVLAWYTDSRNTRKMGYACRAYYSAMKAGELSHDGSAEFAAHIGHACKRELPVTDDQGLPLWTIEKERRGSPLRMDLAMCGVLSWQARLDAIAAGEFKRKRRATMTVMR